MNGALGGLLLLVLAGILGVLWMRGYLTTWINGAIAAVTNPPAKNPINVYGSSSPQGATPGSAGQIA